MEDLGLYVILVNPESLEQLIDTIELLGKACGASQAAEALLEYNSETEAFLSETLTGPEIPTVYLAGNSSYLSTAGAAMYQNTLLELGGGKNVAAEPTDDYWAKISYGVLGLACARSYGREPCPVCTAGWSAAGTVRLRVALETRDGSGSCVIGAGRLERWFPMFPRWTVRCGAAALEGPGQWLRVDEIRFLGESSRAPISTL